MNSKIKLSTSLNNAEDLLFALIELQKKANLAKINLVTKCNDLNSWSSEGNICAYPTSFKADLDLDLQYNELHLEA